MKIMLDASKSKIESQSKKFNYDFWQLRTPLTQNKIAGVPYGLDNGCFTTFHEKRWNKMINDAYEVRPKFVCLPDIVGDARRTLELFDHFKLRTNGLPRALVLQDGIENHAIPWRDLDCIFIGGSDSFKTHPATFAAARAAKIMGKWVHVGRVNTALRAKQWLPYADSIDGSGLSKYDHMLRDVLSIIRGERSQQNSLLPAEICQK